MKRNPFYALLLLLLAAVLLLSACASPAEPADVTEDPAEAEVSEETEEEMPAEEEAEVAEEEMPAEEEAQAEEPEAEPAEKKIITLSFLREWDSLNPMYSANYYSRVTQQIWNCDPWVFDENNEAMPVLLTEMPSLENGGVSEDGKTLTLKLRDDITWSDGEPITADDFIFTWEMFNNPANAAIAFPYDLIETMEAVDPTTVVLTFFEPFIPWRATILREILPAHVLRPVFEAEGTLDNASWNFEPTVGCGPYVLADWESGSYAQFVRNENYYNEPAKIDEVFIRFVPDPTAQTTALLNGDVDLGFLPPFADRPVLKSVGIVVVPVNSGYNEGWFANLENNPAMQELEVRKAVAMCLDRSSFIEDVLFGETEIATSFWHNTQWEDPTLEPWPYDPAMAAELLEQAGWIDSNGDGIRDKDGVELVLKHSTIDDDFRIDFQAVAQQNLADCGIQLEISSYPIVDYLTSAEASPCYAESDFCMWAWAASFPDGDTNRFLCSAIPSADNPRGRNLFRLCDPDLDALFAQEITQLDTAERQQTFYEISRYMTENVYWIGLWNDPDAYAYNPNITGVLFSAMNPYFNINEWDLKQ